jgi:hypothetical protein
MNPPPVEDAAPVTAKDKLDSSTAASGLKEALQVGTGKAVDLLGQADGYGGNPEVRIPVPERLSFLKKTLRAIGQQDLVQEFETSMNRAAEAAAPLAEEVFVDTIKEMSFPDALAIVRGADHEATDHLREHAGPKLGERFRPIVDAQMNNVGATRQFNKMMDATADLPLVSKPAFDLGRYVTDKALDGMFLMIAREEERIRRDPLARTSDLLEKVFGGEKKKSRWKKLFGGN